MDVQIWGKIQAHSRSWKQPFLEKKVILVKLILCFHMVPYQQVSLWPTVGCRHFILFNFSLREYSALRYLVYLSLIYKETRRACLYYKSLYLSWLNIYFYNDKHISSATLFLACPFKIDLLFVLPISMHYIWCKAIETIWFSLNISKCCIGHISN